MARPNQRTSVILYGTFLCVLPKTLFNVHADSIDKHIPLNNPPFVMSLYFPNLSTAPAKTIRIRLLSWVDGEQLSTKKSRTSTFIHQEILGEWESELLDSPKSP